MSGQEAEMGRRATILDATPAERVRAARKVAGLTQVQLARKAGLHPNTISMIERGRVGLSLEAARAIAAATGGSLPLLLPGAPWDAPAREITLRPDAAAGWVPRSAADAALCREVGGQWCPLPVLVDLAREHGVSVRFRGDLGPG
jgi:transcriptional regulator with XRE-family HTH domain